MRSSAEELEGNRVKLSVEIDEDELEQAVTDTVKRLQREVRVPGFRPGKVPRRLLEARLGPKVIREEVIRQSLPEYYSKAVEDAALDTIAAPDIDITSGEEEGPLSFDAVVEVRPRVSIAGYEGLQVTVPSLQVQEEEVQARIDRLREQFAELNDVERPVRQGDVVTVDVTATREGEPVEDLSTTDFVYEVGTAMVAPGLDEKLDRSKPGDIVELDTEEAPGGPATLKVLVKQVREKVLPEADDDWASEASEFETIEELRRDIENQLSTMRRLQARLALRENALGELAKLVQEELPETLVDQELEHLQSHFLQRLSERQVTLQQYVALTGQEPDQIMADLRNQATEQVRADLALRALAEAEDLQATDEDLATEITAYANSVGRSPGEVATQFAEGAALERLRSEIRNSKAMTWLIEHVDVVDEQGNPMDREVLLAEEGAPATDSEQDAGEGSPAATVGDSQDESEEEPV
jgi:trigger factor